MPASSRGRTRPSPLPLTTGEMSAQLSYHANHAVCRSLSPGKPLLFGYRAVADSRPYRGSAKEAVARPPHTLRREANGIRDEAIKLQHRQDVAPYRNTANIRLFAVANTNSRLFYYTYRVAAPSELLMDSGPGTLVDFEALSLQRSDGTSAFVQITRPTSVSTREKGRADGGRRRLTAPPA
jgi:hypothetical protein